MKIAYRHLAQHIQECPSIEHISNKLFQLGHEHEIEGDIFDMEFTPNRGDCLSINGLLRDLAVFYTIDLEQEIYAGDLNQFQLDFENLSESICPKISFLKLEIDKVPEIYKNSLNNYFTDLGLNKNNFFTDVSNYLSYETGQPTHCYDASTMRGKLVFHEVEKNEEFETLLDKKITLTGKNAVFSLNDSVINLAGVVGGNSTACTNNTKTVIVECAFFQPEAIIGKSVNYDIHSEASHKFERGVDPECHERVLRRFISLVNEHANVKEMSIISYKFIDNPAHQLPINVQKINQILGINITENEYVNYLSKLKFNIGKGIIEIPSFRSDIKTQNDLAEEVARVIGYDNIKTLKINIPKIDKANHKNIENKLRFFLLDHGFYEVINSPFVKYKTESSISVDNPLDSNRAFLRTNITHSLIDNLLLNEKRQKDSVKLFEISDVYSSSNSINRKRKLALVASGRVGLNYKDFSKKINEKYLVNKFKEILPDKLLKFKLLSRDGYDTKVKSDIFGLEICIDDIPKTLVNYKNISKSPIAFHQFQPISEFPSSYKDISYSLRDFSQLEELQNIIFKYKHDILNKVFIFDYYKNDINNVIKVGFRFCFQSHHKTLTLEEIEEVLDDVIEKTLKIDNISIPGM